MRTVRAYAPGRTELAGNHTDHQGGRVIAAAVSCGVEMELRPNGNGRVCLESAGFAPVEFALDDLAPIDAERNTTAALVRGVVAGLRQTGVPVVGFDARVTSDVPAGSGLSSSAAFELALATGLLELFGKGRLPNVGTLTERPPAKPVWRGRGDELARMRPSRPNGRGRSASDPTDPPAALASSIQLARIGQRAESEYFGKPCGLMDQAAVACGGINLFDFAQEPPAIERITFDFAASGHALCLIDTHCDHSRYTEEYAQVARDMKAVAEFMGAPVLSQVPREAFLDRFEDVRATFGDLPAMRGLHYYHEMRLVDARAGALRKGDFQAFLYAARQSGASSAQYLQNVSTFDRASQPAMVALALADALLEGEGAARIHGGGFGGTVQAFVPTDRLLAFTCAIDARLGAGSCRTYDIVSEGAHATCL